MSKIRICRDFTQDDSFKIRIAHVPLMDVTNGVFEFILKEKENSTVAILHVIHTAGDDASDVPTTGEIFVPVTREHTSSVPAGTYWASLKRTIGTNTITLMRSGVHQVEKVKVTKTFIEKVV